MLSSAEVALLTVYLELSLNYNGFQGALGGLFEVSVSLPTLLPIRATIKTRSLQICNTDDTICRPACLTGYIVNYPAWKIDLEVSEPHVLL